MMMIIMKHIFIIFINHSYLLRGIFFWAVITQFYLKFKKLILNLFLTKKSMKIITEKIDFYI